MRFNHRIVEADDDDAFPEDWELPAEFAQLGEQLSGQADQLGRAYPSPLPERLTAAIAQEQPRPATSSERHLPHRQLPGRQLPGRQSSGRRLFWGSVAAAGLLVAMSVSWSLFVTPTVEVALQSPAATNQSVVNLPERSLPAIDSHQQSKPVQQQAAAIPDSSDLATTDELASRDPVATDNQPEASDIQPVKTVPMEESPAMLFQEMNSAELEGVLDLLDEQDPALAQLSI